MKSETHLSLALKRLISRNRTHQRAVARTTGLDHAKVNRICSGDLRCQPKDLKRLRTGFPSVGDQLDLLQAHALDELGEDGLEILLNNKPKKPTLALSPQVHTALSTIETLPPALQEAALSAITATCHTLVEFSKKTGR